MSPMLNHHPLNNISRPESVCIWMEISLKFVPDKVVIVREKSGYFH